MIIEKQIKLVIIDSVASLIRKELQSQSSSRSAVLMQQASALKEIAEGFHIVVCLCDYSSGGGGGGDVRRVSVNF